MRCIVESHTKGDGTQHSGRPRLVAYGAALALALALSWVLVRMPLQVTDSVVNILAAQERSLAEILRSELQPRATYLRPFFLAQYKIVFELAHGHYFGTFKAIHVFQLVVLLLLCVRLMRIGSALDLSAGVLALVMVVGIHTFYQTVNEAYPMMTMMLACVLAVNLSFGAPAPCRDASAVLLFFYTMFTAELGVLVWLCLVAGYLLGFRGVGRAGLAACTALLAFYVVLRFVWLSGGVPALSERSSGFGFRGRSQAELVQLFAQRRGLFYAYNVASSVSTVLLAEPRAGSWRWVGALAEGRDSSPAMWLNVATSTAATVLLARFLWRRRKLLRPPLVHHDRLVLLFLVVLPANAIVSFPYTKDVIMSPAGALYAMALFVALRGLLSELAVPGCSAARRCAWACLLLLLSTGWTLRALAVPYALRRHALVQQREWIFIDEWAAAQRLELSPRQRQLLHRLRREAIAMHIPQPYFSRAWPERWFDRP
ncbi:MAG TPA: hypothetical protein VGR82_05740 [Methylomirabilota bacterium]|nr:hypothetical protein [Methylomirabilota bacterium]